MRQKLADKVSGTLVGTWLLIPELLRLGIWDLLTGWADEPPETVAPRLALQLLFESALCVNGVRQSRSLTQRGLELAAGLPFLASDPAIHQLLDKHTVAQAQDLQRALGRIRRAGGHYQGRLLVIDPHLMRSYSKRDTLRQRDGKVGRPFKSATTFFCLDADTHQPIAFTTASASRTIAQATPELLSLVEDILHPRPGQALILADAAHYQADLFSQVASDTPFDLVAPIHDRVSHRKRMQAIPPEQFTPHWPGFATTRLPYRFTNVETPPMYEFIQRCGERPQDYHFKGFLSTSDTDELEVLTQAYPKRWHVEEFFNTSQALGWKRGGTLNLNIRYGQMTMALLAQAAIHQLRQRLGAPVAGWDAKHLAQHLFQGLDGDIRVKEDTIIVTYYNAPNVSELRQHYAQLPQRLEQEGVDPHIPWLYGLKLDFRFR